METNKDAVWSLMLASGYLKVDNAVVGEKTECDLSITNREVLSMFKRMVTDWFRKEDDSYNNFIKYLLEPNLEAMNDYMNRISESIFSSSAERIRQYGFAFEGKTVLIGEGDEY